MHEWALAESVVTTVVEEARKNRLGKVTRVVVKIGELQQLDREVFRFVIDGVLKSRNPEMEIGNIVLETDRSVLQCRVCATTWGFADQTGTLKEDEAEAIHFIPEVAHVYMRCPQCGSPDFEIRAGRGVRIESIEGEG
jgi:hydrogenase nickel incorporation protein HypA/HybF